MLVAWVTDFSVPAPTTRGGEISTRALVGRVVAVVDVDAARQLTDEAEAYAGTVSWRSAWWSELWNMVHSQPTWALVGRGYGYPIWDLHPEDLHDVPLHTPHNIFVYILAYTGWVGIAIFLALQGSVGLVQWRVFRLTGQPFGLCHWTLILVWSSFDSSLETPFVAIPSYLIAGLASAPILSSAEAGASIDSQSAGPVEDSEP
jgi:O-antigen ligase